MIYTKCMNDTLFFFIISTLINRIHNYLSIKYIKWRSIVWLYVMNFIREVKIYMINDDMMCQISKASTLFWIPAINLCNSILYIFFFMKNIKRLSLSLAPDILPMYFLLLDYHTLFFRHLIIIKYNLGLFIFSVYDNHFLSPAPTNFTRNLSRCFFSS